MFTIENPVHSKHHVVCMPHTAFHSIYYYIYTNIHILEGFNMFHCLFCKSMCICVQMKGNIISMSGRLQLRANIVGRAGSPSSPARPHIRV